MTNYRRQTKPDAAEEQKPKALCMVSGCRRESVVMINGVERCARHYTDEVDELGRDASRISKRFQEQLSIEQEEQRRLGPEEYRRQAIKRMKQAMRKMVMPKDRKDDGEKRDIENNGPQLGDLMTDEEFFAKNPGWLAYKRGEEDLKEALLSSQKKPT